MLWVGWQLAVFWIRKPGQVKSWSGMKLITAHPKGAGQPQAGGDYAKQPHAPCWDDSITGNQRPV